MSVSEDGDKVADGAAASDDADAEFDGDGRSAPTAVKWGVAGLLLVYAGLGSYAVASALGHGRAHLGGVTRSTATALAGPAARAAAGASSWETDAAAVAAAKSYAARMHPARVAASPPVAESAAPPVKVLTAVSATAIGPLGASDGDHPQLAQYVLNPRSGTSWITQWYASPHFGALKDGTGLLLDMGRVVTIRQVQLALAGGPGLGGADVEIRIGDVPDLANAEPVAEAYDVGGWVMPKLRSPARGRYVQIWFTKLPLDPSGTYQEHVYGVTVHGSSVNPGGHRRGNHRKRALSGIRCGFRGPVVPVVGRFSVGRGSAFVAAVFLEDGLEVRRAGGQGGGRERRGRCGCPSLVLPADPEARSRGRGLRPAGVGRFLVRPAEPGAARFGAQFRAAGSAAARHGAARHGGARRGGARSGRARYGAGRYGAGRPGAAQVGAAQPPSCRVAPDTPGESRPGPGQGGHP